MHADALPGESTPIPTLPPSVPTLAERVTAVFEIAICSGFPTQFLLQMLFAASGLSPQAPGGGLRVEVITLLLLADTVLMVGLIYMFLAIRGDRPSQVFFGGRPVLPDVRSGIFLIPVAFVVAAIVLLSLRALAPWMHNVENNPFRELLRSPRDAALFAIVAVVAGGVREELQRAFILNRFERWLGGGAFGVIVGSAMFGAGHAIQGMDAAVATAVLGAFWGIVYLWRRSVVAPIVSHSGFDLLQLLQLIAIAR